MIPLATPSQRSARGLAAAALLLAVSGCATASPSGSSSTEPSESSGPSSTPIASASASSTPDQTTAGAWTATGAMIEARYSHTATLLLDGTVLVAGGHGTLNGFPTLASAELYDPGIGSWTATGSMIEARGGHTATLLRDGKVLVAGALAGSELYDPGTGSWTATGSMTQPRYGQTATLLPDGKVLVAGGRIPPLHGGGPGGLLASSELYDPASGSWTATGSMIEARGGHTATLLSDGTVLVAGGHAFVGAVVGVAPFGPAASAELYDPGNGTWTATESMDGVRSDHTAVLLPDGKVLVAGGYGTLDGLPTLASAELYDPGIGSWTATGSMIEARGGHTATLLPDGKVLVAGAGIVVEAGGPRPLLASSELYEPSSGSWTATGGMIEARASHTATPLPDGAVLVAGGCCAGSGSLVTSAELYDPGSGS